MPWMKYSDWAVWWLIDVLLLTRETHRYDNDYAVDCWRITATERDYCDCVGMNKSQVLLPGIEELNA